jgi:hypothetical protein
MHTTLGSQKRTVVRELCKGDLHFTRWGRMDEPGNACDVCASLVTRV